MEQLGLLVASRQRNSRPCQPGAERLPRLQLRRLIQSLSRCPTLAFASSTLGRPAYTEKTRSGAFQGTVPDFQFAAFIGHCASTEQSGLAITAVDAHGSYSHGSVRNNNQTTWAWDDRLSTMHSGNMRHTHKHLNTHDTNNLVPCQLPTTLSD